MGRRIVGMIRAAQELRELSLKNTEMIQTNLLQ